MGNILQNSFDLVNIPLFDGDVIYVARSISPSKRAIEMVTNTNLSPSIINVYMTGQIKEAGIKQLPQGTTLNQAIASAGGARFLHGKVEFFRFVRDSKILDDRRSFKLDDNAAPASYKNPVLMNGDIIRINSSVYSIAFETLNEVTTPILGFYGVYSFFRGFKN